MHRTDVAGPLLEGLEKLLRLHNEVFNDDYYGNWSVAWPEEYRVMRSILQRMYEAEAEHE